MRNVELKARLSDIEAAREIAESLATNRLGRQHQVDTYFVCPTGRLKLRQIDNLRAELIWYARSDQPGPKASDYRLVPIANPESLKAALAAALGVLVVVDKQREIFLVENVRIHLDEVRGLGEFLEFEAVLGGEIDDSQGENQVVKLQEAFGIEPSDLLADSYSDILLRSSR